MLHLIILFRTSAGVKCCLFYSKQWSTVVLNYGCSESAQFFFQLVHSLPDFWSLESGKTSLDALLQSSNLEQRFRMYVGPDFVRRPVAEARPHRRVDQLILLKDVIHDVEAETRSESFYEKKKKEHRSEKDIVSKKHLFDLNLEAGDKKDEEEEKREEKNLLLECPQCGTPAPPCLRGGACPIWQLLLTSRLKCTLMVNGHLASCMINQIALSKIFRRRLFMNLLRMRGFCAPHTMPENLALRWYERFCDFMNVDWLIDLVSIYPEQRIDYAWGWYMNHILTKRLLLDDAMAWLSTLGGAHSSLGEYYHHHAEMAGHISRKQLKLALTMGDPLTIGRCYMFWAFSLLQRYGCNRTAKKIVRCVHGLAKTHSVQDIRLINMCLAAWRRLQHLHALHRVRGAAATSHSLTEEGPSSAAVLHGGETFMEWTLAQLTEGENTSWTSEGKGQNNGSTAATIDSLAEEKTVAPGSPQRGLKGHIRFSASAHSHSEDLPGT